MGMSSRARAAWAAGAVVTMMAGCGTFLDIDSSSPTPPETDGGRDGAPTPPALDGGAELDGALLPPEDAAVDLDAADAGFDQFVPPGCPGIEGCERVVFLTKDPVSFAALELADQACTAAATKATAHPRILKRLFVAWTSTMSEPVAKRFVKGTMPYVRPVGANRIIAANWNDLTDGALALAIFHDEEGNPVGGAGGKVWTGTLADGTFSGPNCSDWGEGSGMARVGVFGGAGVNWSTFGSPVPCTASDVRLYCFEK
ncbi:hypothetical protein BH11MYX4_BH11MYX4_29090 [soil metagenome]